MTKIIIIILILGVFLVYPGYLDLRKTNLESAKLDKNISKLEETNKNLQVEIRKLKKDNFYIEKVARETLGLVKPGEIIYKISSTEN
ncbi:MAG: septum formation initiator family protein [Nitrospirae bacterium]|nr:septum formation initiator family protein [Nitrospirota bacterium]